MSVSPVNANVLLGELLAQRQHVPPPLRAGTPRRAKSGRYARDTQHGQSRAHVVPRAYCPKCRGGLNPTPVDARIGRCPHCKALVRFNFTTHAYQRAGRRLA